MDERKCIQEFAELNKSLLIKQLEKGKIMNTIEREKQQRVISVIIEGIEFKIKGIVDARDEYRKAKNDLSKSGSEVYSQIYLDRKTKEINENYKSKMQTKHDELVNSLEQLRQLIKERDSALDLANPALGAALLVIQTLPTDPDRIFETHDQAQRINANFTDQASLRALQSAYKARGLNSPGGINEMIYNVDDTINNLIDLAEAGTLMDSTMNGFAGKFAKFAALEGIATESTPDMVGAEEAFWRGAGLPMPVK